MSSECCSTFSAMAVTSASRHGRYTTGCRLHTSSSKSTRDVTTVTPLKVAITSKSAKSFGVVPGKLPSRRARAAGVGTRDGRVRRFDAGAWAVCISAICGRCAHELASVMCKAVRQLCARRVTARRFATFRNSCAQDHAYYHFATPGIPADGPDAPEHHW